MTDRKTIEEVLAGGVMAQMNHINAEKVSQLFESEQEIADFDTYFMGLYAERKISYQLNYYSQKSQLDLFLSSVLTRFFPSWLKIKNSLTAEYDVLKSSDSTKTITETRNEKGTNTDSETTQENANAFDSVTPSDTQGSERAGQSARDITTTFDRTETSSGESGTPKASLIEKEIYMRLRQRFFDIVATDIASDCCSVIYD